MRVRRPPAPRMSARCGGALLILLLPGVTHGADVKPVVVDVLRPYEGYVYLSKGEKVRDGAPVSNGHLMRKADRICPQLDDGADQETHGFDRVEPGEAGFSEDGLSRVTEALQAHVDAGDVAGVVAAVMRDGRLVYGEALGHLDLESREPMPFDALFRIYSMTRPITALGILMLHDAGLLDVHAPLSTYLPQFAGQEVLRDPSSVDPSDTRPREGEVTIAHLLTHTSGIGNRNSPLYRVHDVHRWDRTLEEVVDGVAALPLFEDPGTRFRYGMHSEVLGRVIEVVTGTPLPDFFEEHVFRPLGMRDTVWEVDLSRQGRLATVHRPDEKGRLRPHEMEAIPVTQPRALTSSGIGLVSSTADLVRFAQFLLDDDTVDGERLVSPEVVRMMRDNWIPEPLLPLGAGGYWAGSGWSLGGFAVVLDPAAYNHTVNPGEFWWDGSAGTRFWIDPAEGIVAVVNAQVSPASGNGFRERFKTLVYEAIVEPRARRRSRKRFEKVLSRVPDREPLPGDEL